MVLLRRTFFIALAIGFLPGMGWVVFHYLNPVTVYAPHHDFQYEVVTTKAAQERGLGGRAEIPHNYGMLFVFPTEVKEGFWMKDMRVPIDMVWLNAAQEIIAIDASVSPDSYPEIFYPPAPVRYVIETRGGEAALMRWKVGSVITFPKGVQN